MSNPNTKHILIEPPAVDETSQQDTKTENTEIHGLFTLLAWPFEGLFSRFRINPRMAYMDFKSL